MMVELTEQDMNSLEPSVQNLLSDLRELISAARMRTALAVNAELVMLYWSIGQRLGQKPETRATYGERVMQAVAEALSAEFGQGFSKSVLSRAIHFYELCPDEKIVATVWQQLSWSHIRELLPVKDDLKRDFYVQMTILERWSVRTLREYLTRLPPLETLRQRLHQTMLWARQRNLGDGE
jgi:predicted nuclease of restriction endonuclease-like (RecB) superfamily